MDSLRRNDDGVESKFEDVQVHKGKWCIIIAHLMWEDSSWPSQQCYKVLNIFLKPIPNSYYVIASYKSSTSTLPLSQKCSS